MGTYSLHAGHGLSGGRGCGAVGILDESKENRIVNEVAINYLQSKGNQVYDDTCNCNASQNSILSQIVKNCNSHRVDYVISIHLNYGRNDYASDGATGGVECYVYNDNKDTVNTANNICNNISSALDIRNRGVKLNTSLYVLRETNAPAILIECCFVDDKDDADRWDAKKCGIAIAQGILGQDYSEVQQEQPKQQPQPKKDTSMCYRAYVQDYGMLDFVTLGEKAGTEGESKRLEALKIAADFPIKVEAQIQDDGWINYGYINRDTLIGTEHQSKAIECLCIDTGSEAIEFRVHIAGYGWSNWTRCDGKCTLGSVGKHIALEAVQFRRIVA